MGTETAVELIFSLVTDTSLTSFENITPLHVSMIKEIIDLSIEGGFSDFISLVRFYAWLESLLQNSIKKQPGKTKIFDNLIIADFFNIFESKPSR